MRISYRTRPTVWLAVILAFVAASTAWFGYLWVNSGGTVPGLTTSGYRVSFPIEDADNIVYFADVRIAGVAVGKVVEVDKLSRPPRLTIEIDPEVSPIRQGATVRIGSKSLVEESYVDVVDGKGPALPDGATLPPSQVESGVQLDQVLNTFDPPTRGSLGATVRSLDASTRGRSGDVDRILGGLGRIGRDGSTALDAVAGQTTELRSLASNTRVLLDAVDGQQGQIADLVRTGQQVTMASADGRKDVEESMRALPDVLGHTAVASDKLTELSRSLAPVAADLRTAAPPLTQALQELPATSQDLRGLLPALDGTLDAVGPTLDRVPRFGRDTRAMVSPLRSLLRDVNPMLAYLQPYGRDAAAFLTNFGAQASQGDSTATWARISLIINEQSFKASPLPLDLNAIFDKSNAYPKAGTAQNPQPFTGTYPRVQPERTGR